MANHLSIDMILSLVDKISGPLKKVVHSVDGIGDAADKAARRFTRLSNQVDKLAKDAKKLDALGKPLLAAGTAGAVGIGLTVKKFADLEEAQTRLKTNMMDSAGKVGPEYEKMLKLAEKLGTDLPGSTQDMLEMFTALREQGVQTNVILGGMGEAAAKFSVIMNVPFVEAATHVAKLSEAMGIADEDAVAFMDTLQRLKSAGGVNVQDLTESFKYSGAALKALGLQGQQAGWDVSAAIGMMATSSIEGSQAGTNFAMALSRMAEISHRLDSGKVAKLVGPILDAKGIKLNFFDEAGNFKGIRAMMGELEKLRTLSQQDRLVVLSKLFGQEAARPLSIFIDKGVKGFDQMTARMKAQADMQKKIDEIMGTSKMRWETMTGTVGNLVANIGGMFAKLVDLPAVLESLNATFGKMNDWVLANPRTAGVIGGVVAALTALALVGGGILMTIAAIGSAVGPFLAGLAALSRIVSVLSGGFRIAMMVFRALQIVLALMGVSLGPVIIAVVALAAAAYLIYKNWEPIKAFFIGIWKVVVDVAGKMYDAGAKIVTMLWEGIKSMAMKPVEAIKNIVQKIRNHLPFSPAKEGPLRDIHRIRLIETIAGSMKPAPMVNAMRAATAATMMVVAGHGGAMAGSHGGGGTIQVTQNITVNASDGASVRREVEGAMKTTEHDLEKMLQRILDQQSRRRF
ncbi:MAG: phage tail tape measure protein [Chlorobiaceae bacterium]|nr:phage tail tape measure protein [Chlorobiaceae bacterium]